MSDKRTTPDPSVAAGRPKRSAPTIDLTASEVTSEAPHVPAGEATPEPDPAQEKSTGAHAADEIGNRNWLTSHVGWQLLAAGFVGAAIMMIAVFVFWSVGLVPARYDVASNSGSPSITALNERVGKVESATAKIPNDSIVSEHLSAADSAMKSLGISLTALSKRTDDVAARVLASEKTLAELRDSVRDLTKNTSAGLLPADVANVQKRLDALERASKTGNNDNAARLALSAAALRDAVASGMPFNVELDEAKSLGANDKILAPLAPFAPSGIPSAAALGHELHELIPAMQKVSGAQPPESGFLERLEANAANLVRIRPVGAPVGDDVSAVLARIEIESAKADIAGALADLGKLSSAVRVQAQDWIAKAQARQAALAAARQFAAETARALGKQ